MKNRKKPPTKPANNIPKDTFPAYAFPCVFIFTHIFRVFYRLSLYLFIFPAAQPVPCGNPHFIFPIVIPFCETRKNKVGE